MCDYGVNLNTLQDFFGTHMNIGERLREEREKIGYSQEKLGAIGGVQKRAQINYEAGERQPDAAYLRGVAQVGIDVQYVLLGVRSANLMEVFVSDDFVKETNSEHARKALAMASGLVFALMQLSVVTFWGLFYLGERMLTPD